MNDIVQVSQVSKIFSGNILAIDNVSLSIRDGEFVTLLGPSGCGKTTMLRMIAGFEIPTDGKIYLSGEDVTEFPPYERRVNTVFQDYALFPHMTIQENVGYGLRVGGMSKFEIGPAVAQALAMVGLQEKADSRPSNLSGGQKQRVALARAMVRKPKVLLLDEPLSALDANLREAMQVELKHLHQQSGITFVFVTHDQTEALVMSDRVVVMDTGRIAQSGTPQELYDQPASPYIANFIGSSNKLYGTVSAIDGELLDLDLNGIQLQGNIGDRQFRIGDRVIATIRPEKVQIETSKGGVVSLSKNELRGKVRDILFHGSSCRLKIDTGQQKLFDVDVQLLEELGAVGFSKPDTDVLMRINPRTVSVFPISEDMTS